MSELHRFGVDLLTAADAPPSIATTAMDVLVVAEQWGLASHGLLRLPWYLDRIEAGGIDPRAEAVLVRSSGSTACYDGQAGIGQAHVMHGARHGAELAAANGVSVVSVGNSNHSGCLGAYVLPALEQGLVAIVVCNGPAVMPAWGGSRAQFSTSPIAAGIPAASGPWIIDMSLSAVARGRIAAAHQDGEALEPGWAYASDGRPTRDASEALVGMLAPFGGVKGAVLAFLVEALSGGLVGPRLSTDVADPFDPGDHGRPQGIGHLILTLDPSVIDLDGGATGRLETLREQVEAAGGRIPGASRLPLPDLASGTVEVAEATMGQLRDRAARLGIPVRDGVPPVVAG